MHKILGPILIAYAILLPLLAMAQENKPAASTPPADAPAFEEVLSEVTAPEPKPITEDGSVAFSLLDDDIIAWEESGEGKYIYFTLTEDKNRELAALTEEYRGQPMILSVGNTVIRIPEITDTMDQSNGFVLMIDDKAQRQELALMLGWEKRKKNTAEISINAGETPEEATPKDQSEH